MTRTATLPRTGGRILIDQLRLHGASVIFGVPGESYLAALDALHDAPEMRFIVCRHEAGAAHMAEAHGKLTGRPGICFVTRGPGAAHASIGCHTAFQDSTPMILLVGQVARGMRGREAFQEIDVARMFDPLVKWAAEVDDAARLPEFVSRAFATAMSGRPGPVVLSLPEDMLRETASVQDPAPATPAYPAPGEHDLAAFAAMLREAERPLLLVGGGTWSARAADDIAAFAAAHHLPVAASFRCQDFIDNESPNYVGHVGIGVDGRLADRVRQCDLLVAIGARLGEATTSGYTLLVPPRPARKFVHVFPDPAELGRVYQPDLPIAARSDAFLAAARDLPPIADPPWRDWLAAARADYLASLVPPACADAVDLGRVVRAARDILPEDAIVANGAGNFAAWLHRYFRYRRYRGQVAPTNGAMGYGVPAAIASAIAAPARRVVAFCGDGDFMMCAQELATARQYRLPVILIVVNNGVFGTIRMHQERAYPGRVIATDLVNPDFAALAAAHGLFARKVTTTEAFAPALTEALGCGEPALIEVITNPDTLLPGVTVAGLRALSRS